VNSKTLSERIPLVRRSLDGGQTWQSVATWTVPSGFAFASGSWGVVAVADVNGVVYASASYGKKIGKTTQQYWLTYRSANNGASWILVDTLPVASGTYGPSGIASDAFNRIFITGAGAPRATADGGGSWHTLSQLPGASSVATDLVGDVFIGANSTEGFIYKQPASAP
jgi:hypothetical protein